MQKKFGVNTSLIISIKDNAFKNFIVPLFIPLALIFNILALNLTADIYNLKPIRWLFWLGILEVIVVGILYIKAMSETDYKRQELSCNILGGLSIANCLIVMLMKASNGEDIMTLAVIFLIIFVLVTIANALYFIFKLKNAQIVIDNLNTCYLQLSEKNLCGISFKDITKAEDGTYFELEYSDIRNTRTPSATAIDNKYYNLFIDSKYGTYKLSVAESNLACKEINNAIKHGSLAEIATNNNSNAIIDETWIICPNCNQKQAKDRTYCFKCGAEIGQTTKQ